MNKKTKEYFMSALVRAFHTFWEVFASLLVVGAGFGDIDWINVFSVSGLAAVLSIAKSFAVGLPEQVSDGEMRIDTKNPNKDVFTLALDDDIAKLADKKRITFVVNSEPTSEEMSSYDLDDEEMNPND